MELIVTDLNMPKWTGPGFCSDRLKGVPNFPNVTLTRRVLHRRRGRGGGTPFPGGRRGGKKAPVAGKVGFRIGR